MAEAARKTPASVVRELRRGLRVALSDAATRLGLARATGHTQYAGRRDLWEALGYEFNPTFAHYLNHYERGGIARRIIELPPQATWSSPPEVFEVEDPKTVTPFEAAWLALARRLDIFHYLERVDRVSRIGRYGVLLFGVGRGSLASALPARIRPEELLYLSVFSEGTAVVKEFESNSKDPRFGLPRLYEVTLAASPQMPAISLGGTGTSISAKKELVHWSRVLHVAENLDEDEVYGRPALKPVLNLLDDLLKIVGGSAEAMWRTFDRGIVFEMDKDAEMDEEDEADLSDEIDDYMHALKRYIRTRAVKPHVLGSDAADPRGGYSVVLSNISGAVAIPQRILSGSEQGQLASAQDRANFADTVRGRQVRYAGPRILHRFIDWCIRYQVLPTPSQPYMSKWPDPMTFSEIDRANIARAYATAANLVAQQPSPVVSQQEAREHWFRLPANPSPSDTFPQAPARGPTPKPTGSQG